MPATAEQEVARRGGATAYRTVRLPNGRTMLIAVVPQAGPHGGHTVALRGPVSVKGGASRLTKKRAKAKIRKARRK